ncbi:MAG: septal ring lytic transglycosylase RlpA family protein [Pseudoalteromonas sp.]|jgi:rare lipoprotein A
MNTLNKYTILVIALSGLSACSVNNSRYSQKQDSAPEFHYGELELADATPRYEPYAPANFRPYTVLGQYYTPMLTAKGYEEHGEASWYGQKFHGHLTSNGEVYDMFSMTAAHKTLPLPSFVKVTNLDNQKIAIVRVNDRGPFHPGRVIDLSYAAAKKLDVLSTGVANVKVEIVHIDEDGIMTVGAGAPQQPEIPPSLAQPESNTVMVAQANTKTTMEDRVELESAAPPISNALASVMADNDKKSQIFVQVAAFSNAEKVSELSEGLARLYQVPTDAPLIDNIYRLRLGPLINEQKAEKLIQDLKSIGFDSAFQILSAD